MLICSSEEAVEAFISFWEIAARDPLMPQLDAVIVLSTVLRIKRALNGRDRQDHRSGGSHRHRLRTFMRYALAKRRRDRQIPVRSEDRIPATFYNRLNAVIGIGLADVPA
jgi:hypothetical protein